MTWNLDKFISIIRDMTKETPGFYSFWKDMKKSHIRKKIRTFLQDIYRAIAIEYGLPMLPVYLPAKYKISKLGSMVYASEPRSVVVYMFWSPRYLNYTMDKPSDLTVRNADALLETLAHEIAHVVEFQKRGKHSHDKQFHKTMKEIHKKVIEIAKENDPYLVGDIPGI